MLAPHSGAMSFAGAFHRFEAGGTQLDVGFASWLGPVNFAPHPRVPIEKPSTPDLDALLREVAIGDELAFEAFYAATVDRCFGLVRGILGDRALAEDCVSDVFTQVWRNALDFDALKGSAMAWLLMIARTRAIDLLRRERRHLASPLGPLEDTAESMATPEHHFGGLLAQGRLKIALTSLSEVQKRMLELAFFKDLSHGEIAKLTGIPIGTVKSHLRRALGVLKQELVVSDEI